jgi:hypothetical protein
MLSHQDRNILTPEQIYDYMHDEHTPYSAMSKEDGKKHIIELIERYAHFYHVDKLAEFGGHKE